MKKVSIFPHPPQPLHSTMLRSDLRNQFRVDWLFTRLPQGGKVSARSQSHWMLAEIKGSWLSYTSEAAEKARLRKFIPSLSLLHTLDSAELSGIDEDSREWESKDEIRMKISSFSSWSEDEIMCTSHSTTYVHCECSQCVASASTRWHSSYLCRVVVCLSEKLAKHSKWQEKEGKWEKNKAQGAVWFYLSSLRSLYLALFSSSSICLKYWMSEAKVETSWASFSCLFRRDIRRLLISILKIQIREKSAAAMPCHILIFVTHSRKEMKLSQFSFLSFLSES